MTIKAQIYSQVLHATRLADSTLDVQALAIYMTRVLFPPGVLLPLYRAEYVLGLILGMTYFFGAILSMMFAFVLVLIFALLFHLVRPVLLRGARLISGALIRV